MVICTVATRSRVISKKKKKTRSSAFTDSIGPEMECCKISNKKKEIECCKISNKKKENFLGPDKQKPGPFQALNSLPVPSRG